MIKVSMMGPSFMYWLIFVMLFSDSYDNGFDAKLVVYAFTYLLLALTTSIFQE